MAIIKYFLDDDLYKFSMQQIVFHRFQNIEVDYEFINRKDVCLLNNISKIREGINSLENLKLTKEEYSYLNSIYFFKKDYVEFLRNFRLNPKKYVKVEKTKNNLSIKIKGPWLATILFEVKILAIISEIYTSSKDVNNKAFENAKEKLNSKIKYLKKHGNDQIKFTEFGTRRRMSFEFQDYLVETLKNKLPFNFLGTSNVYLSMKHNVKCFGTMAHEYIMAHQAIYGLYNFQKIALDNWNAEYRGELGLALTDTINSKTFLKEFDKGHAKLYDGVRQDSGDPKVIGNMIVKHYEKLGIDPLEKTILFSDGLNFEKTIDIWKYFFERINSKFGIGTFLSNDNDVVNALSIVIKMTYCQGLPVCKVSDEPKKSISPSIKYLKYVKEVFGIEEC